MDAQGSICEAASRLVQTAYDGSAISKCFDSCTECKESTLQHSFSAVLHISRGVMLNIIVAA